MREGGSCNVRETLHRHTKGRLASRAFEPILQASWGTLLSVPFAADRFVDTLRSAFSWNRVLATTFIVASGRELAGFVGWTPAIGYDARLYSAAARAMVEGADPWRIALDGGYFAGPPTTLVPFVPFAFLPAVLVSAVWVGLNLALAIRLTRALRLPSWWIAFPPIFLGIVYGSVEILMIAILIEGGRWSGLAAVLKPYAVLPLVAERRWAALVTGGVVAIVSVLVLPWAMFIANLDLIGGYFGTQGRPLANVYGDAALMAVAGAVLLSFGWRRALWLATPVMWPGAQAHYSAMTIKVLPPVVALCWALPIPEATLLGVGVGAAFELAPAVIRRLPINRDGRWSGRLRHWDAGEAASSAEAVGG